ACHVCLERHERLVDWVQRLPSVGIVVGGKLPNDRREEAGGISRRWLGAAAGCADRQGGGDREGDCDAAADAARIAGPAVAVDPKNVPSSCALGRRRVSGGCSLTATSICCSLWSVRRPAPMVRNRSSCP